MTSTQELEEELNKWLERQVKYKRIIPFAILTLEGLPPAKSEAGRQLSRRGNISQLRTEARDHLDALLIHALGEERARGLSDSFARYGDDPFGLYIIVSRSKDCGYDSANIVGGIADALTGIWYKDDRYLVEITYREAPATLGEPTR